MPGFPDVSHFPFATWRKLVAKQMRLEQRHLAQYGYGGYGPLKLVLAEYLRVTRMMSCSPQQILILNGSHQALDLCARMLADVGDVAWMEDPGYWGHAACSRPPTSPSIRYRWTPRASTRRRPTGTTRHA